MGRVETEVLRPGCLPVRLSARPAACRAWLLAAGWQGQGGEAERVEGVCAWAGLGWLTPLSPAGSHSEPCLSFPLRAPWMCLVPWPCWVC